MSVDSAKVMDIAAGRKAEPSPFASADHGSATFAVAGIDKFPGPAFVVCADNWLAYANVHAEPLVAALRTQDFNLVGLINRCLSGGATAVQKITLGGATGSRHFDVYALPIDLDEAAARALTGSSDRRGAMVFARETTLEHNLTAALVDSRQMFKDLVTCCPDFVWETDAQGVFRYVSATGAFGYGAHELTGRRACDLIDDDYRGESPFATRNRVDAVPLSLRRNDGGRTTVLVTAIPTLNARGEYLGARGSCRDITEQKRQEDSFLRLQTRHTVMTKLASLARDVAANDQLLTSAAAVIGQTFAAPCWILRRTGGEFVIEGTTAGPIDPALKDALCDSLEGIVALHRTVAASRPRIEELEGRRVLLAATVHGGAVNGAVAVIRDGAADFTDDELTLLDEAGAQISVILKQAESCIKITELSRIDELTGLLNAKAFAEVVERRIKHQKRSEMPATLLLLEVDGYQDIVDRFGVPLINRAMKQLGEILRARSRAGDVLARLDEHRLAIWLEDTDVKGAGQKARLVIRQCQDITLGKVSGTGYFNLSVGGAPSRPADNASLDDLLAVAAKALAQATARGRGRWSIHSLPAPDGQEDREA